MNSFADRADIEEGSVAVNGRNKKTGRANGIEDRTARWNRCRAIGSDLLPEEGFLMTLNNGQQSTVWSGAAQLDGPAGTTAVRVAPAWLRRFLPSSFSAVDKDTKKLTGPWVRDQINAITNETVTGVFDLTTPIDFGDGKIFAPKDVPPETPVNFVTLLRIVGARQAVAQGLLK